MSDSSWFWVLAVRITGLFSSGCFGSLGEGQPHGFSVSTQLYSLRPPSRAASLPCRRPFFLCLSLLCYPRTSVSNFFDTIIVFSPCLCGDFSLAFRTLSVIHSTPRMQRMSSFLFLFLKLKPRIHRNIFISVLSKRFSSRLLNVHASEPYANIDLLLFCLISL